MKGITRKVVPLKDIGCNRVNTPIIALYQCKTSTSTMLLFRDAFDYVRCHPAPRRMRCVSPVFGAFARNVGSTTTTTTALFLLRRGHANTWHPKSSKVYRLRWSMRGEPWASRAQPGGTIFDSCLRALFSCSLVLFTALVLVFCRGRVCFRTSNVQHTTFSRDNIRRCSLTCAN